MENKNLIYVCSCGCRQAESGMVNINVKKEKIGEPSKIQQWKKVKVCKKHREAGTVLSRETKCRDCDEILKIRPSGKTPYWCPKHKKINIDRMKKEGAKRQSERRKLERANNTRPSTLRPYNKKESGHTFDFIKPDGYFETPCLPDICGNICPKQYGFKCNVRGSYVG